MNKEIISPQSLRFGDTSFDQLMQRRIRRILIVCSHYDFFMLEEDGRIDEQIFNEYASLNLRYPPVFYHAPTAGDALKMIEDGNIDLVIAMLHVADEGTFKLSSEVKKRWPGIPVVLLTPFSREVSLRLQNFDLTDFDYVFCWLGNADLLVAIVKLLEDNMNAPVDVEKTGVQVILLVEDSIRYTSGYLPILYKIVFNQARDFMKEGLNEHQKMMRMRGRPKILLATNYNEAIEYYERYRENIIGVISDVSYKKSPIARDSHERAGLKLAGRIRADDIFLPVLLQSSNLDNKVFADDLGAGFLYKYSKNLYQELRTYVVTHFAFGPFVFRHPKTLEVVGFAHDLKELQEKILQMPDEVLEYHSLRNDFSKWLNARALFPLARLFKSLGRNDFSEVSEVRSYLYGAIDQFRTLKARGVIAQFDPERFDRHLPFTRTGGGSVGGKARGIAFADFVIHKHNLYTRYPGISIDIPLTVAIGTDVFDEFLEENNLVNCIREANTDEEIVNIFVDKPLPAQLTDVIRRFAECVGGPLAVRSSSKLEDSYYQPFAGVYSTYMIPGGESQRTIGMVETAIKSIYASAFFKESRAYLASTSNIIDEEKMGIILQEVVGAAYDDLFYPTCSGVARSVNYYPVNDEKPEEGVVYLAYGLGRVVVEGGLCLRFSPSHPRHLLQLSSPQTALRETQKYFYGLCLDATKFRASVSDTVNFKKLGTGDIPASPVNKRFVLSWYDYDNQTLSQYITGNGRSVVSFNGLLQLNLLPFSAALKEIVGLIGREMNKPVEIEFALQIAPDGQNARLSILQVRPIVPIESLPQLPSVPDGKVLASSPKALGNGQVGPLYDIVFVKTENYNPADNPAIAATIGNINDELRAEKRYFILIGPGRWGSSDPWLGIPVRWAQITNARVVVELSLDNYAIDPSQGTHFFMNLTSFQTFYLTINEKIGNGKIDLSLLAEARIVFDDNRVAWVRSSEAVWAIVNGCTGIGTLNI